MDTPVREKSPTPMMSKIKRDRFMRRLQENYGYNKEGAKTELDRLLKEFYDKNKRKAKPR
jgi:hypothetical protein